MRRVAKEFLFFLAVLILAVPLTFLFLQVLLQSDPVEAQAYMTEDENVFIMQIYLIGYLVSIIGIYIVRLVIVAVKVALLPADQDATP